MTSLRQTHREAMVLVKKARIAKKEGLVSEYKQLLLKAFKLERQAALVLADKHQSEPTRSVLFRSAANLALEVDMPLSASELINKALEGNPHHEIKVELETLKKKAEVVSKNSLRILNFSHQFDILEDSTVFCANRISKNDDNVFTWIIDIIGFNKLVFGFYEPYSVEIIPHRTTEHQVAMSIYSIADENLGIYLKDQNLSILQKRYARVFIYTCLMDEQFSFHANKKYLSAGSELGRQVSYNPVVINSMAVISKFIALSHRLLPAATSIL